MKIKVINIVSSVSRINIGVWSVVVSTFESLGKYEISSEIITIGNDERPDEFPEQMEYHNFKNYSDLLNYVMDFDSNNTLIVSHGNWTFSTKAAYKLKSRGYCWIFFPHGMLEPWSFDHKPFKKKLYYGIIEKRRLRNADAMVAVGGPEYTNLVNLLPDLRCEHIPNGIQIYEGLVDRKYDRINFLYLARLHKKKRPLSLIKAWVSSKLHNNPRFQLTFAGPDEGEYSLLNSVISDSGSNNIYLSNPVYGNEKKELLLESHFFILPSISEGFPTTIIESMTHGCIPIISTGCNFPEAVKASVAYDIPYPNDSMISVLEQLSDINEKQLQVMSLEGKKFADSNYSVDIVSEELQRLYQEVLTKRTQ